jgi:hypothetical protein
VKAEHAEAIDLDPYLDRGGRPARCVTFGTDATLPSLHAHDPF